MGECEKKKSKKNKITKDINVVIDNTVVSDNGKCTYPPEDVKLGDECRSFDRCIDSQCVGADISDPCLKGKCEMIDGLFQRKKNLY